MINMGSWDRRIRAAAAVVLAVVGVLVGPGGVVAVVLYVVAAILLVTALVGFCPLYRLVGLSTARGARSRS